LVESNYDILGVQNDSSQQIVREAFRKLALQHHSDRGGDDERFKKIKLAFEELNKILSSLCMKSIEVLYLHLKEKVVLLLAKKVDS